MPIGLANQRLSRASPSSLWASWIRIASKGRESSRNDARVTFVRRARYDSSPMFVRFVSAISHVAFAIFVATRVARNVRSRRRRSARSIAAFSAATPSAWSPDRTQTARPSPAMCFLRVTRCGLVKIHCRCIRELSHFRVVHKMQRIRETRAHVPSKNETSRVKPPKHRPR